MTNIRNILALLRGQFWIVPALITVIAALLAFVVLRYGSGLLGAGTVKFWWLYSGDASTARDLLSSLLSGLITMTSLVVSLTFVILTLAANQLGPRLISIFMSDREIQLVLGLFIGTILYIILVLRTLNDTLGIEGVPHVAVTIASALTVVCLFSLLFYIHKIGRSIIADTVVNEVAHDVRHDLANLLPERDAPDAPAPNLNFLERCLFGLGHSGYVQVIDYDALVRLAAELDGLIEVKVQAGDYVLSHGDHAVLHTHRPLEDDHTDRIRDTFTIGSHRTPAQDPRYGLSQLVEIALRALSPGINDPHTAIAVIDHVGSAFEVIFGRSSQEKLLTDEEDTVRVVAERSDAPRLAADAFDPIRQAAAHHPSVLIRMADTLRHLAPVATSDTARNAVLSELRKLAETARLTDLAPSDRDEVLQHVDRASAAIEGDDGPEPHRTRAGADTAVAWGPR
jgi:uncharacterized membrane protein